jgi:DNA-binding FadR family transcriptional regulator
MQDGQVGWIPPRRRQKLSDEVAIHLEEQILTGQLAAGQRLPIETELTEQLSVSRTVIRDAVRVLAARGLLDVRQGLGTIVTPPTSNGYAEAAITLLLRSDCTVGDMFRARQFLDEEMTSAAIRNGDADWSQAEAALEEAHDAAAREDWTAFGDAHHRFHVGLMAASRNPVIELLLGPMNDIIQLSSELPYAPAIEGMTMNLELHPPMLAAAKQGSERKLRAAVAAHYAYTDEQEYVDASSILFRDSQAGLAALRQHRERANGRPVTIGAVGPRAAG